MMPTIQMADPGPISHQDRITSYFYRNFVHCLAKMIESPRRDV
jgi:hypothetical protein